VHLADQNQHFQNIISGAGNQEMTSMIMQCMVMQVEGGP